jgi:hypothetical protein
VEIFAYWMETGESLVTSIGFALSGYALGAGVGAVSKELACCCASAKVADAIKGSTSFRGARLQLKQEVQEMLLEV